LLSLLLALSACLSTTVEFPTWKYTEAEVSVVFDRRGFRGVEGWGWQVGTLCFSYDRYKGFKVYGWEEDIDKWELWYYTIGEDNKRPEIRSPYHKTPE
jgi:hypothetical protein